MIKEQIKHFAAYLLLLQLGIACRPSSPETAALGKAIDSLSHGAAAPGGVLAVQLDGKTIFQKAFGAATLEHPVPNTLNTIFEAGSVSKQFTAAAILLLATENQLSLDDNVRRYIPELPVYDTVITIRNLLTHTSGIKDWGTVAQMGGWPRTTRVYSENAALDIIFSQRSLNFRPGTSFAYSNSNYNLLALVVERVAGRSLAAFTRERLFLRAGMNHTGWRTDFREIVPDRAVAYRRSDDRYYQFMPFENTYGHAALLTTVNDLLAWNAFLAAKGFGEAFDQLRLQQLRLPNGRLTEYACGALFLKEVNGYKEIGHSGSTAGYRAWLAWYPEKKLSVAYLGNDASIASVAIARTVTDIFLGRKGSVLAPASNPAHISGAVSLSGAGVYQDEQAPRIIKIGLRADSLYLEKDPEWNAMYNDPWKELRTFSLAADGVLEVNTLAGIRRFIKKTWQPEQFGGDPGCFTGRFYSAESDGTVWIDTTGTRLQMRYRSGPAYELHPLFTDQHTAAFITDNNILIEFSHSGRRVTAFSASLSQEQYMYARADHIVFNRKEAETGPDHSF